MTSEKSGSKCYFPDLIAQLLYNISTFFRAPENMALPWPPQPNVFFHLHLFDFRLDNCIKRSKQMECGLWLKGTRGKTISCPVSANGTSGANIQKQMQWSPPPTGRTVHSGSLRVNAADMLSECFSPAPNQRPLPQICSLNITMLKLGVGLYQIGGLCSVPKRSEVRGVSRSPYSQVDIELPCYRVAPVTATTMYQGPLRSPFSSVMWRFDGHTCFFWAWEDGVLALPLRNSFPIKGSQTTMCRAHSPLLAGRTKDRAYVRCSINVCYGC